MVLHRLILVSMYLFVFREPALPSASMMLADNKKIIPGGVFSNPFREAEDAKIASLEKHVKMVRLSGCRK